jgi:hypothetical protein
MRVYEKHPTSDAYRFGPSYTPYAIVAVDKRFTGPELAAEYWQASSNYHANTFHRFAALPSYDEES